MTSARTDTAVERLTTDELRTLFLFEALTPEQLDWLSTESRVEAVAAGDWVYRQGADATCFYVLLDGTLVLSRTVRGEDVQVNRTDHRGVYSGATQAYLGEQVEQTYQGSLRAITDCRFVVFDAEVFARMMRDWFPMAMHLLEGLFFGLRSSNEITGQRERLLALGQLSAGLTHELNNPAAAAVRATAALRERVAAMRHKLAFLADGRFDGAQLHRLVAVQEQAVERATNPPVLSPLEESDAEDAVNDWLEQHGITDGYDIAPVLAAAGLDPEWLERLTQVSEGGVHPVTLTGAVRWLAYTCETEGLLREIEDSTRRITTLVGAAKQYSQMDRAPYQRIDVHDGVESTLVMLGRNIGPGVRVVKDFDRGLPEIPAYAAELNQVWTNLVDNALQAMGGTGTLTVRTARVDERVVVSIGDTGPGVPVELRQRIFEPFFTTKPQGEGTGLGLDISWRIVVTKHGGDLRVRSTPGDTWFDVSLPLTEPTADLPG